MGEAAGGDATETPEAVEGAVAVEEEDASASSPEIVLEEKPKRTRKRPAARAAVEAAPEAAPEPAVETAAETAVEPAVVEKPKRASRAKAKPAAEAPPVVDAVAEEPAAKPKRASRAKAKVATEDAPALKPDSTLEPVTALESDEPRRGGWWQRTFGPTE